MLSPLNSLRLRKVYAAQSSSKTCPAGPLPGPKDSTLKPLEEPLRELTDGWWIASGTPLYSGASQNKLLIVKLCKFDSINGSLHAIRQGMHTSASLRCDYNPPEHQDCLLIHNTDIRSVCIKCCANFFQNTQSQSQSFLCTKGSLGHLMSVAM